jgi:hypothetical protein
MKTSVLSDHAEKRSVKRGIPQELIDLLYNYGTCTHRTGIKIFTFNKKSMMAIQKNESTELYKLATDKRNCSITVGINGKVVTVCHRLKRVYNKKHRKNPNKRHICNASYATTLNDFFR